MHWQRVFWDANVLVLYDAGRIDKGLTGSHPQLGEYMESEFDVLMFSLIGYDSSRYHQYIDQNIQFDRRQGCSGAKQADCGVAVPLETKEMVITSAGACEVIRIHLNLD